MLSRAETPPPRRCPTSGDEWTKSPVSAKAKDGELMTSPIERGKALWTPAQDSCFSSQSSPSTRASSLLLSPASQQRSAGKENRAPRISGQTPSRLPTVQENDGMPAPEEVPLAAEPLSPVKRPILELRAADPPVKNTFINFESPNKTRALRSPPKTEPPSFAPEFVEDHVQYQGVPFPPPDPACLSLAGSFDAVGDGSSDRGLTVRISDYLPDFPEGPRQNKGMPLRLSDYMGSDVEAMPAAAYGGSEMYWNQTPPYQPEAVQQLPAQMLAALHSAPMEQFMAQLHVDPMQVQHYVAQMLHVQQPGPQPHGETFPVQQRDDNMWTQSMPPPGPSMGPMGGGF
ncbi:unnamed protein product [Symbiodinium natans]|uniref:Uncharacterized protein n=1 Tax=Symbiodinium natans TaxID=878477 RepID=A0A812MZ53_9DINO|nr:unnamed protein product [Symbiodinium natans]